PTEAPTNLQVVDIHDTYADLQWDFTHEEINKMPSSIRGEFRGFQIQVWQYNNKASTVREWNISAEEALETRVGNTFTGRVEGLLPVTDMQASVAVMNNFYISQPTDAVNFTTTAGSCQPGWYGDQCDQRCSEHCLPDDNAEIICLQTHGNCSAGCSEGWYTQNCSERCGENCDGGCERDTGVCVGCVGGYYGMMCEFQCGKGCVNGTCSRQDSACSCLTGWSSPDCTECNTGYYGVESCEECGYCRDDDVCNNTNGHCPRGCRDNFDGDLCNKCDSGYYGVESCEECGYCRDDDVCNNTNGHCLRGCRVNFDGDRYKMAPVHVSLDGPLLTVQNVTLVITVWNLVKSVVTVVMMMSVTIPTDTVPRGCRDGFSGDLCNKCITGRWSANCSLPCGQCAGDGSCDMDTGRCIRQGDVNVAGPIIGSLLQTEALIGLPALASVCPQGTISYSNVLLCLRTTTDILVKMGLLPGRRGDHTCPARCSLPFSNPNLAHGTRRSERLAAKEMAENEREWAEKAATTRTGAVTTTAAATTTTALTTTATATITTSSNDIFDAQRGAPTTGDGANILDTIRRAAATLPRDKVTHGKAKEVRDFIALAPEKPQAIHMGGVQIKVNDGRVAHDKLSEGALKILIDAIDNDDVDITEAYLRQKSSGSEARTAASLSGNSLTTVALTNMRHSSRIPISVQDALSIIQPNWYMAKVDLKSAYRCVPIRPENYAFTGMEWTFADADLPNPCLDNFKLDSLLAGIRRVRGTAQAYKLPVSPNHLLNLRRHLDMNMCDCQLWAAILVGFGGLLRVSNFTDSDKCARRQDVHMVE
ncbi:hypothetical protein BaRGS_00026852, partial [Batillaria attramentaria]